jgi:hypothetical protein
MNQLAHWIKGIDEHNTFMDKNMAGLTGNFGIGCVTCHKFGLKKKTRHGICQVQRLRSEYDKS